MQSATAPSCVGNGWRGAQMRESTCLRALALQGSEKKSVARHAISNGVMHANACERTVRAGTDTHAYTHKQAARSH